MRGRARIRTRKLGIIRKTQLIRWVAKLRGVAGIGVKPIIAQPHVDHHVIIFQLVLQIGRKLTGLHAKDVGIDRIRQNDWFIIEINPFLCQGIIDKYQFFRGAEINIPDERAELVDVVLNIGHPVLQRIVFVGLPGEIVLGIIVLAGAFEIALVLAAGRKTWSRAVGIFIMKKTLVVGILK